MKDMEINVGVSADANVLIANGEATATISKSSTYNANYYSEEATLNDIITKVKVTAGQNFAKNQRISR